jgi:alpha-ketoglutarate-dependent taurine dioxygenase
MTTTMPPIFSDSGALWHAPASQAIVDLSPAAVTDLVRATGLVLLRGFDVDVPRFKQFTDSLCSEYRTYVGGASARRPVGGEETVLTVTEPDMTFGIPLHGEMYYTKHRPEVLCFYCARPAAVRGETTVADGVGLYQHLSPQLRELFATRRIKYVCTYPQGRWQQLFQTDDPAAVKAYCDRNDMTVTVRKDGSCVTEYLTSAILQKTGGPPPVFIHNMFTMLQWELSGAMHRVVRWEDGSALSAAIVNELLAFENQSAFPLSWQPGDVLVVDNTRFLHGRRDFSDSKREIYVRLGGSLRT